MDGINDMLDHSEHFEHRLLESNERFRLLVEGVGDYAIYMLDPAGHILSWNLGGQRNKGYTKNEVIGQHFSVLHSRRYPTRQASRYLRVRSARG